MRHTIPTPFLSCILRGTVLCTMPKISEQGIFMSVSTASFNEAGILAYNDGNYAEAFKQFDAAARTGDPAGQHLLASLYYQGHGVTQDVPKAVELFTAAAQAGFPPSLANLALMYASGDGVAQDIAQSLAYGRQAAEAGDGQSQFNLAQAYRKGDGVPQDYAEAAFWYKQAAEAGSLSAQNEYGLLYAQGQGVELDYVQAYAWIAMPAEAGSAQSIKNRDQLLEILTPSQQQAARALAAEYAAQYGVNPH